MKKLAKFLSYVLVAALSAVVTLAVVIPQMPEVTKLDQLSELIEERFIGEADKTAMEDAAAHAMVDSLGDRWSYYIPASEYGAYREQMNNAYVGVGITIQMLEGNQGFEVTVVNEGGPADLAGMEYGDIIIAVEGQDVTGMTASECRELVRGEIGTRRSITVLRSGEKLELTMELQELQTVVATGVMLPDSIGLVTIENFDSRCAGETLAAIDSLLEQGAEALIFDVRNNPGGYAAEMVSVLDYLLPEGPVFTTVDFEGNESTENSDADFLDLPMAVLVNEESYSAAEFFAVTLSEYEAAAVVGAKTCGKGYFQVTYRLSDGSAVGLSIGEYYTPNGNNLAGIGITPDVEVSVDEETFAKIYAGVLPPSEDPQIQAAVEVLQQGR